MVKRHEQQEVSISALAKKYMYLKPIFWVLSLRIHFLFCFFICHSFAQWMIAYNNFLRNAFKYSILSPWLQESTEYSNPIEFGVYWWSAVINVIT